MKPIQCRSSAIIIEAFLIMSLKNINKAIQDLGDALFYDPHNPEVHYHIGLACLKSKDFEGSTKFFTNCIHYDPGNTFAYSNLAYTYN